MTSPQLGSDLRDRALDRLGSNRAEWLNIARGYALQICRRRGQVTADDVREILPIPPEYDGRVMGAVFCKSLFQKVGYKATTVASSHGRPVGIFKAKERA